jgi:hypothetical protein
MRLPRFLQSAIAKPVDPEPAVRATPDASYVEIAAHRAKVGRELEAVLYLYEDVFIVSSVSGIAETGEPTVLLVTTSDEALGRCVCDHLLQFELDTPSNLRDAKLADWRAYVASGAKSRNAFEAHAWYVSVSTAETALVVEARPRLSLHDEIAAKAWATPEHRRLGAVLRRAVRAAQTLRDAGIV